MIDKVFDDQEDNYGDTENQTVDDTDGDADYYGEEQQDSGSQSDSSWSEEEKTEFAQTMRSKKSARETEPDGTAGNPTQTTKEEEEEINNNAILPTAEIPVIPTANIIGGKPRYLTEDLDGEIYDAVTDMFEQTTHSSDPRMANDGDDDHDEGEYGKMPSPDQDADVRVAAAMPPMLPTPGWSMGGEVASATSDDAVSQSGTRFNTEHRHNKDVYPGRNVCSGVAGSFLNHVDGEQDGPMHDTADTHDTRYESSLHSAKRPAEPGKNLPAQARLTHPLANRCTCSSLPHQI